MHKQGRVRGKKCSRPSRPGEPRALLYLINLRQTRGTDAARARQLLSGAVGGKVTSLQSNLFGSFSFKRAAIRTDRGVRPVPKAFEKLRSRTKSWENHH